MKRIENMNGDIKTIVETYNNFNEFCKIQNERPLVWDCSPTRDVVNDSEKRCNSFAEAQNFLLHGFNENVKEMVSAVGELQKTGTRTRNHRFADVVGYTPIVPNAIIGVPTSMLNQKKKPIKTKVVTIDYDPTVSWDVTPKQVLDFGCKFINCVMNLEKQGYRVRINYLAAANSHDNRQYVLRIPLKSEHNPLNIKRLSFPISHVAMLRYLFMDWEERLPNSEYIGGHGHPMYAADAKNKENLKSILGDNTYIVTFKTDLDVMFKQLDIN